MNSFDVTLLGLINHFAQHSWRVDALIGEISGDMLVRSLPFMLLLWWAWFREPQMQRNHELVVSGLVLACAALVVARILGLLLPFRERPLLVPALHFIAPFGDDVATFNHWNSFPSDHAALFFALATTLLLISRPVGLVAYAYTLVLVCLPRLYLGMHYPSDVLAGAALGIAIASLSATPRVRDAIARPSLHWFAASPASFYPCLFVATLMLTINFEPALGLGTLARDLARHAPPAAEPPTLLSAESTPQR